MKFFCASSIIHKIKGSGLFQICLTPIFRRRNNGIGGQGAFPAPDYTQGGVHRHPDYREGEGWVCGGVFVSVNVFFSLYNVCVCVREVVCIFVL